MGLALGGGIGYLMRPHGLTADNIINASLVLANGTEVWLSQGVRVLCYEPPMLPMIPQHIGWMSKQHTVRTCCSSSRNRQSFVLMSSAV